MIKESIFSLSDGRDVEYVVGGDIASSDVFVSLHGVFGVGDIAPELSLFFAQHSWRVVAPTLPGWGRSSAFPQHLTLSAYASDMAQLLSHCAQTDGPVRRVVFFGGSYGSVWAMACAANCPPQPLQKITVPICGLVVFGGFSPFREDVQHAQHMTWMNYLSVGPWYYWFSPLHWLMGRVFRRQVADNVDGALSLLRQILTGPSAMTPTERAELTEWAEKRGSSFEKFESRMAANMSRSVSRTLEGFDNVPTILNSDWGFRLSDIRISSGEGSIVILGAKRDHLAPIHMQRYLAANITGAQLIELDGNHISAITATDRVFASVFDCLRENK